MEDDSTTSTDDLLRTLARSRQGGIIAPLARIRTRPDLASAVARLLADESDEVRTMALIALTEATGPEALGVARQALGDRSPRVRAQAVRVLGALGKQAVEDLTAALSDPDPQVVTEAAKVLAAVEPRPDLLRQLLASPEEARRRAALEVLGRRPDATMASTLVEHLRDPSPRARYGAVQALAMLGPEASGPLAAALRDNDASVREEALRALTGGTGPVAMDASCLLPLLTDQADGVRLLAMEALRRVGDTHCAAVLPLLRDPAPTVRARAMTAVAGWACADALPELRQMATESADEHDRVHAVYALRQFDQRLPDPLLLRLLADPSAQVRVLAATAATGATDPAVGVALVQALVSDPSAEVRRAAAEHVIPHTAGAVLALSQAARTDAQPVVRRAALRAIPPSAQVVTVGMDALGDSDPRVRATAADWLGRVGTPEVVQALVDRDRVERDEEVRAELLRAAAPLDEAAAGRLAVVAAARRLFDPAGEGRAATAWFRDLDWYPASDGFVFYNTGALRVLDDDEDGGPHFTYEVSLGRLRVRRPDGSTLDTAFAVAHDEQPGADCVTGRYRLTLQDDGPPFGGESGAATLFCVAGGKSPL